MKLKHHCLIGNLILILGVALAIAGAILRQPGGPVHWLLWVALVLVLGSVVYKSAKLLCPGCGRVLPARYKVPKTCPHCGMEVTDNEKADR